MAALVVCSAAVSDCAKSNHAKGSGAWTTEKTFTEYITPLFSSR